MTGLVAWLAENSAEDDFLFASGRFRGYIDLGSEPGEHIEDANVDEALEWAQKRADVVLIRLWDSDYFSAGKVNPDPRRYPEWRAEGIDVKPRRPRGLSALHSTEADPAVPWDVRLRADPLVDPDLFRSFIETDLRTEPVQVIRSGAAVDEIRVLVRASTQAQAWAIADELDKAANDAADPGAQLRSRKRAGIGWSRNGPSVYPYAPDAPVSFGGTVTVEQPNASGPNDEDA